MFADQYLKKQEKKALISIPPEKDLGMTVVIPCLAEADILKTLDSLSQCDRPLHNAEVIVLINHSESAPLKIKKFNEQTKNEVESWISANPVPQISFFAPGPVELQKKWAGAGLARKTGMDEALLRFNILNRPEGIIISLDADTLVEKNYLTEIERHFLVHPGHVGALIPFTHQKTGLPEYHLTGISLYEKYMEYFGGAVKYTGYPWPVIVLGSAFAVRAGAYVRRGGMTRRQAGEDFYFMQNLTHIGKVDEISATRVYPSARVSDRVPFGTGKSMQKWMNQEEDLSLTYDFQAFEDLRLLFSQKEKLFRISEQYLNMFISSLPVPLFMFLSGSGFTDELKTLNQNCSSADSFSIRFFHLFNAFRIIKFLNYSHEKFYKKKNLDDQFRILQEELKTNHFI